MEVTDGLGVTIGIRDCFPRPCIGYVESLGFCSLVGALGLTSCFFVWIAKLAPSVIVKTRRIETMSWITIYNPPINLASC
jgi:hypothetical protein